MTAAAGALRAHVAACAYFCRSLLSIDMLPCSHPPVTTSPVGKAGGSSDPPTPLLACLVNGQKYICHVVPALNKYRLKTYHTLCPL